MRTGDEELLYPVPWATIADTSVMETADDYSDYLKAAGFTIVGVRNRKDIALDFYKKLRATTVASNQVSPLGLHILMGQSAPTKVKNMLENVSRGRIAPVEILAKKPYIAERLLNRKRQKARGRPGFDHQLWSSVLVLAF
jgi:hypothetical protein